jgi:hypothetical protein
MAAQPSRMRMQTALAGMRERVVLYGGSLKAAATCQGASRRRRAAAGRTKPT